MPTTASYSPKAKITVTLSPELVRQIDALTDTPKAGSRSRLVEEAVRHWVYDEAQKELERQTEEYYLSLSRAERKEDKQWSKIAARSAKRLWSEAPRSKLRGIRSKTKRNCAGAGYPPSPRLRRGHLALRPHSKLWGIRAEASE